MDRILFWLSAYFSFYQPKDASPCFHFSQREYDMQAVCLQFLMLLIRINKTLKLKVVLADKLIQENVTFIVIKPQFFVQCWLYLEWD